eukprot:UN30790
MLPEITGRILDCICKCCEYTEYEVMTLGLCCLRDLILKRPNTTQIALKSLLSFADSPRPEVSDAAVRLLTNILFPEENLADKIEVYAMNCLNKLTQDITDFTPRPQLQVNTDVIPTVETEEQKEYRKQKEEAITRLNELKMQKWQRVENDKRNIFYRKNCSLFLALATKKPSMLFHFINTLAKSKKITKVALSKLSVKMISTLGINCPEIIKVITTCPPGAEGWVRQVCHVLLKQERHKPTPQLLNALQTLYFNQTKDIKILIPVLEYLQPNILEQLLPEILNMDIADAKKALQKLLMVKDKSPIKPTTLLIRVHTLAPNMKSPLLRNCLLVIQFCLAQSAFGGEELKIVLSELVMLEPIPVLFMRTLIQSLLLYPQLTNFAMDILRSMISKKSMGVA